MSISRMTKIFMDTAGGAAGAAGSGTPAAGSGAAPITVSPGVSGTPPGLAGGGAPGAGSVTPPDWMSGLAEESRGYAQNKGWKDPGSMLESYRNLEKLTGGPADRLVRLPKEDAAPEWNDVYTKLGKPAKADDYTIPMPQAGGDESFAKWAKETFHGANLTTKQAEILAGKWNEFQGATTQAQQAAMQAKVDAEATSLKTEWGAAHDQNIALAQRAAGSFGIEADTITKLESTIGYAGVMKMFAKIGKGMGEDSFVGSNGTGGGGQGHLTPGQAAAKLTELRADKAWSKKYVEGDTAARAEAVRLLQYANPTA